MDEMTPREKLEHQIAMAVRDAWLATAELANLLAKEPDARELLARNEGDLWSVRGRVINLCNEIKQRQVA